MPVCITCNRRFVGRDALQQHLRSSGLEHPLCIPCDRRFISEEARDGHMAARHPPTYPCKICDKIFSVQFALEDHYRGSAVHPNCGKCGRGFKDIAERTEHQNTAHRRVPCVSCGGVSVYEESLNEHYLNSDNHPSCALCGVGFENAAIHAEHVTSVHPELRCDICKIIFESTEDLEKHYFTSDASTHRKCRLCRIGFKNDEEFRVHVKGHSADGPGMVPTIPDTHTASRDLDLAPPRCPDMFKELVSEVLLDAYRTDALPRPTRAFENVWSTTPNIQISSSFAPRTTPLVASAKKAGLENPRSQTAYASPSPSASANWREPASARPFLAFKQGTSLPYHRELAGTSTWDVAPLAVNIQNPLSQAGAPRTQVSNNRISAQKASISSNFEGAHRGLRR